jgi:hypothetical protein
MSTSVERRAAELRAQADAIEQLADREEELLAAKQAYAADPTPETKAIKDAAAKALRESRALARPEEMTVGGDAYADEEV